MPVRTLGPKEGRFGGGPTSLEKEKSVNEDAGPDTRRCASEETLLRR